MASTVIIGAGVIGLSTAYYLSTSASLSKEEDIHVVEASPELFASASGNAGGFLAADWFSSSSARLGQLSFDLHKQLAAEHDGGATWGYSQSFGASLAEYVLIAGQGSGADWLREGASRAVAAENTARNNGNAPSWLRDKGPLDVMSNGVTTAQVNPRLLCQFLLSSCLSHGVHLHQPCKPLSLSRDAQSHQVSNITILHTSSAETVILPCTRLLIAAGPWSPQVFAALFPTARFRLPISPLAGHSLVLRSPYWPPSTTSAEFDLTNRLGSSSSSTSTTCHAVFTTDSASDYSPELFSRMPDGEIYLAGLNSSSYPLPATANAKQIDPAAIAALTRTAHCLLGANVQVLREAVCWRPVWDSEAAGAAPGIKGTVTSDNDSKSAPERERKHRRGQGESGPLICELDDIIVDDKENDTGKNIFVAAGHGAWGISLSLGTGWCVAGMLQGRNVNEYVGLLGL